MHGATRRRIQAAAVVIGWWLLALGGGSPAAAAPGVATIAAGDSHACAVRTDGTVWCWGSGASGQLGDGTRGDPVGHIRPSPVRVLRGSSPLRDATKVTAGGGHSCAVRTDGGVICWGDNEHGQLGNGQGGSTALDRTTAVRVRRGDGYLTGVTRVSAGFSHTCALRSDGGVVCWGDGSRGQVGDGGSGPGHIRTSAVRVRQGNRSLTGVTDLTAGEEHTCAIKGDGSAWCWGSGLFGQLGDGASGVGHHRATATRVRRGSGSLTRVTGIAAGGGHSCARRADGTAWCWGFGRYGQLGDGTTAELRTTAVQVRRGSGVLTNVTGIAAGGAHSCARRSDGSAWCWGLDNVGQLGDGTAGDPVTHVRTKPVRVVRSGGPLTSVRKLVPGDGFTCALRTDRTVWCWADNALGQVGQGAASEPYRHPTRVRFP